MSTHLAEMTSPEKIFEENPGYGLMELDIADLREFGLTAIYMPEQGQEHVAVLGLKALPSSQKEKLAKRIIRAWEPGSQQITYDREAPGPRASG